MNRIILKHLVDCFLAFGISFLSILAATNEITLRFILISLIPSGLVALIKFRDYWATQLKQYSPTPTLFL